MIDAAVVLASTELTRDASRASIQRLVLPEVRGFSPTQSKVREINGYIRRDGFKGLNTLPIYGRLNTPYYIE